MTGLSRQNYYKQRKSRCRQAVDKELVLNLVRQQRQQQPCLGARKLLRLVGPELQAAGVSLGRDRFMKLLRLEHLLLERRRRSTRTTQSGHGFAVYSNLAKEMTLSGPHELLVSDITYIRTLEGFMYLSLVMDAYSRKIVGYDCSDSLEMQGALRALGMALKQLPVGAQATHHSDRGIQYCCGPYTEQLKQSGVRISMTQENHCYENSQAERLNGILKQEYSLGETFARKVLVQAAVSQAVILYNQYRPHTALGYRMPAEVHDCISLAA